MVVLGSLGWWLVVGVLNLCVGYLMVVVCRFVGFWWFFLCLVVNFEIVGCGGGLFFGKFGDSSFGFLLLG